MAPKTASDVQHHCRILLAEDEAPLRNLIRLSLETHGHTVFAAADGVEALQLFEKTPVDLVILDVMMPRMDGVETCRRLRAMPGGDRPHIIFLTARSEEYSEIAGLEAGVPIFLSSC